jgi:ABC-type multidrug transport system fused ATPase/permease subunit
LIKINRVILPLLFLQGMIYHKINHLSYVSINRWRGVCLEMVGILLVLFTSVTAVLIRSRLTAGTVDLMITYAMQVTSSLNILVRIISDVETNIVSVERINEYAELTPEAPWEIPTKKPSSHWPTDGSIRYIVYSTCGRMFNIHIF